MFEKATYRALEKWREIDVMCGNRWTCDGCEYHEKFGNCFNNCTERILMELGEIMRSVYDDKRCMQALKLLANNNAVVVMSEEQSHVIETKWQTGKCETEGTYWVYSPTHRQVFLAQRWKDYASAESEWEEESHYWEWVWTDYFKSSLIPDEEGLAWMPCEVPEYKE